MLDSAKRYFLKVQLRNMQRAINKDYEKNGLTDDILRRQVELNIRRSELDIPDESEFIYEDFVQ